LSGGIPNPLLGEPQTPETLRKGAERGMKKEDSFTEPASASTDAADVGGLKRTIQIKFRVTKAEQDLILEKMRLLHTNNLAAYMRKIAIDGYVIAVDNSDIKAMTAEIQKIGVNINQIARRLNATGRIYEQDIDEIKKAVSEIWRLQRLSLSRAD